MTATEHFRPSDLVLVTGANGHVAQHIVSQLLSLPSSTRPRVRASVRSDTSASTLRSVFPHHISADTLDIAQIPDLTSPSAFTAALQGVTHIAHVASPLVVNPSNVERDLLIPAIQGTTSLLQAASASPTVQAVVVTSSVGAIFDLKQGTRQGYTYSSKDWTPITYEEASDPNLDLSQWPERYMPFVTYTASKKLAEKAAWEFYERAKPSWRLSTICPGYIAGPYVLPVRKGLQGLSYSVDLVWRTARSRRGERLTELEFMNWVDVRDVAGAHVRALLRGQAGGKRLIVAPNTATYADMAGVVRERFGWDTSDEVQRLEHWEVDMIETEKVLGMKEWRGFEEMIVETVEQLRAAEGV